MKWANHTKHTMRLFHIPQCTIHNRNVPISVLNGAFWDIEQMHCGICELGPLIRTVHCSSIPSQIASLTMVYSTVYSAADQRKHQNSSSQAFVWRIHRWPVNSWHNWPVTRKMFPFDDVTMLTYWSSSSRGDLIWIVILVYIGISQAERNWW